MNRLNFNQMVNKNLLGQEHKFFNVTQINPEAFDEPERQTAKITQAQKNLNLDGKINSIVSNLHKRLEEQNSKKSLRTELTTTGANFSKEMSSPHKKCLSNKAKDNRNINSSLASSDCKNNSTYRMKGLCSDERKGTEPKPTAPPTKYISYQDHKRIMAAMQRQNELQNMIREHKELTKDRRSLEQDIFAVRHSLDDLQRRVSSSLRDLSNKKTYCDCHGLISTQTCEECNKKKKFCKYLKIRN